MKMVWLASYPRSGVTFLRLLLERLYGVPTHTVYTSEWRATGDLFPANRLFPQNNNAPDPTFVKTHGVDEAPKGGRAIHLVRDPRDALVSHAHFACDFSHKWMGYDEAIRAAIHGNLGIPTWGAHTVAWLGRPAVRIHFDDLIANPLATITEAVEGLDLGMKLIANDGIPAFEALKAEHPKFFRSGKSEQWRDDLPKHLLTEFIAKQRAAVAAYEAIFKRAICGQAA